MCSIHHTMISSQKSSWKSYSQQRRRFYEARSSSSSSRTILFLFAATVLAVSFVAAASASSNNTCENYTTTAASNVSSSSALSDAKDFQRRISNALNPHDGVSLTPEGRSLRAIVDNVLSEEECSFLVSNLPPSAFTDAGGYESTSNKYNAPRKGYSGVGLAELAALFPSQSDYDKFLEFREKIRAQTEAALSLLPGTLNIDYTHISQKTQGGTHRPHADNCFHYYKETTGSSAGVIATRDLTKPHPYSNRVAASILYLNDKGYEGGEFYWASRSCEQGTPETVVAPKQGRMTVFTSIIENLHGALPVKVSSSSDNVSRRLALAMWYVLADNAPGEPIPEYGASKDDVTEEEADPNRTLLFAIPVESIEIDKLCQRLGIFLLKKQDTPSRNSWRVQQNNNNSLYMIFRDHTAMISITLKPQTILVSRHTDGVQRPSLMYQLQESVLLHSILTEIEQLASEPTADGLVALEKGSITKARDTLPTR